MRNGCSCCSVSKEHRCLLTLRSYAPLSDGCRRAQLGADTETLDQLLDDRLVFTGPGGVLYSKSDDLQLQRSGAQKLNRVQEEEELTVLVDGDTGVTWFLGTVAGVFAGNQFTARVRYTRTWIRRDVGGG